MQQTPPEVGAKSDQSLEMVPVPTVVPVPAVFSCSIPCSLFMKTFARLNFLVIRMFFCFLTSDRRTDKRGT